MKHPYTLITLTSTFLFLVSCSSGVSNDSSSAQKQKVSSMEASSVTDFSSSSTISSSITISSSEKTSSSSDTRLHDSRDQEYYNTTTIGEQNWMAENLRYKPEVGTFSCPTDSPTNCDLYGQLYTWSTVMGFNPKFDTTQAQTIDRPHQGICPKGWHVPSLEEWELLAQYTRTRAEDLDSYDTGMLDLISTTGWDDLLHWKGNNKHGFAAKGAGIYYDGTFSGFQKDTYFWTDAENNFSQDIYARWIYISPATKVSLYPSAQVKKEYQASLRCIQDS